MFVKSETNLNQLLNTPTSLYEKFHQKTKLNRLTVKASSLKISQNEQRNISYKGYSRLEELALSQKRLSDKISLKKTITSRVSSNKFSKKPLSISNISTLLYYSAGLINKSDFIGRRPYPSAGARYPIELYIFALNTRLSSGIYHYYPKNHTLEELSTAEVINIKKYFIQDWIAQAGILVIMTAIFKRTTVKYGDRGYRYVLIETGHLGQNFYLVSTALGLACCSVGGLIDKKLELLLDIDGLNESIVYALAIGNKHR